MSGASAIEWCDATWNPTRGCSRVSEGCRNCFAERIAARFSDRMEIGAGTYRDGTFQGYAEQTKAGPRWTGRVQLVESALDWPLRWRGDKRARAEGRPSRVFVNSMSDLFHERLSDEEIAAVFGVMAASPQHVFQCLTKRPERMRSFLAHPEVRHWICRARDGALVDLEHDPVEKWARIPGFPGYEASSHGRIRSERSETLATTINPRTGREAVTLWNHGAPDTVNVHQLVALSHLPKPSDGEEVCHRNGNKLDNRLANLRWGTRSENQQEKVRHGSRGGPQKLTPVQVEEIKSSRAAGETQQTIADRYGVSRSLVSMIESGRVWSAPDDLPWPLPNVHLGVSVEDQATADERIPLLLQCPAAVRFVSYEPALGAVDFARWLRLATMRHVAMSVEGAIRNRAYDCLQTDDGKPMTRREAENELFALHARGVKLVPAGDCEGFDSQNGCPGHRQPRLDWLIVGGESGPGARPCHVDWIRSVRDQCKAANVACFIKQMGRRVFGDSEGFLVDRYILDGGAIEWQPPIIGFDKARFLRDNADRIVGFKPYDSKGGRWDEWPEDLRVREFPSVPLLDRQRDERGEGR